MDTLCEQMVLRTILNRLQQPSLYYIPFIPLQSLGQLGRVIHILPNGDFKVILKGKRWILSPGTLVPAPGETPPDYTAGKHS